MVAKERRFSTLQHHTGGDGVVSFNTFLVWGVYGIATATGVLLASDIYRVWGIRVRIEGLREDKAGALEERVRFVNDSKSAKPSSENSQIFAKKTALPLPPTNTNLSGSYSDVPGLSRFYLPKGRMMYQLRFTPVVPKADADTPNPSSSSSSEKIKTSQTATFVGEGEDSEGRFVVEGGIYNIATGRLAWGERSLEPGSRLYAECRANVLSSSSGSDFRLRGTYEANSGRSGELRLGTE